MQYLIIFCDEIVSKDDFFRVIYASVGAPKLAGRNLDALCDVLSGKRITIELRNFTSLEKVLGQYAEKICRALSGAAEESSGVVFVKN